MIDPQELFWSLAEYGKDYISGQDPIPEFNNKLKESERMLFDMLSPEYDRNERIRILLEPFTREIPTTSNASGVVTYPSDFHRVLGGRYTEGGRVYPIYYAKENEITESDFIPQRKANISEGKAYFKYLNGTLVLTPREELSFTMSYLARPTPGQLIYEYNVSQSSYVQVDAATVDLQWNYDAYNLILNILLLKYSLITKDAFKTEIANYGISSDRMNAL